VIVDTNALSAFADGSPLALAALKKADEVGIPVIVLGEFGYGGGANTKLGWIGISRLFVFCRL